MSVDVWDFQEIYEAYQARILRYLARLVGEADAEDLGQEVFMKVHQALGSFRGESQLSTWIYRIATNTAIDKLRSPAYRQEVAAPEPEISSDALRWAAGGCPLPDDEVARREMYQCFESYVRALPSNYRTILVLSELEDLSNQEIGDILGLSLDVVKIRLHRGRALLFQQLKHNCKAEDWL